MNIQNIVRASAQIVQITELAKWDAVKIIEESSYSSARVKYGVVTEVMNDGQKWFIQVLVLDAQYSSFSKELKLISEKNSEWMAFFPSSLEEIKIAFQGTLDSSEREIEKKVKELEKAKQDLEFAKSVCDGTFQLIANTPKFTTLPSA